jgi:hypothetical protein
MAVGLKDLFSTPQMSRWAPWVLLAAIVLIWLALRLPAGAFDYRHADEKIALGVVRGVLSGDFDTNWARHDVSRQFRYDQYNFSSYYISLGVIGNAWRFFGIPFDLDQMRLLSALFAAAAIAVAYAIGRRIGGDVVGLAGALLTASSSQLFVDSLYARPDSFFTLLCLIAMYLALLATDRRWSALALAYALIGFLIACKITALLLAPAPALIFMLQSQQRSIKHFVGVGAACALALLVGAFLGAPYAFAHPDVFISGVEYLANQYENGRQGYYDPTLAAAFWHLITYLGPTLGWLPLALALAGLILAALKQQREKSWAGFILFAAAFLSLLYTGSRSTFYERNFSHTLPFLFLAAGLAIQYIALRMPVGWLRAAAPATLAIACFIQPFNVTWALRFSALPPERHERLDDWRDELQQANADARYIRAGAVRQNAGWRRLEQRIDRARPPYLIEMDDLGDPRTAEYMQRIECAYDARRVGVLPSAFAGISTSWLHRSLDRSRVMYRIEHIPDPPRACDRER